VPGEAALRSGGARPGEAPPRSLRSAARREPELTIAVVSVPGRYAAYEAAAALEAGLHLFCFSDGLALDLERELKLRAAALGLLFMGADCGTSILDGTALGFANAVERGPVGIVGASGTGTQEVTCLLDAAGVGVSHAIGVGGRDLSAEAGGLGTLRALELLAGDGGTEAVVVVSKPPDPGVAVAVARAAAGTGKPVVLAFLGAEDRPRVGGRVEAAGSLERAAARAAELAGGRLPEWDVAAPRPAREGFVRGLFCGGTLCEQAVSIVGAAVGPVRSNIALRAEGRLADVHRSEGHAFVDFGADALTEGRAHPMIDPTLRSERLERELDDPEVAVVLLDVVLGFGAHRDPAGELAAVLRRARADRPHVVASLCGTARDPQGLEAQAARLREAGGTVTRSAAHAARLALAALGGGDGPPA
jgi:FdrA protein